MAAQRAKKNSAFLAFQQHAFDLDSDGSDHERVASEQKQKQKQRKKAKNKKKSSENSLLKDLAFCSVSNTKKSKSKNKSTTPVAGVADSADSNGHSDAKAASGKDEAAPQPSASANKPSAPASKPTASANKTKASTSKPSPRATPPVAVAASKPASPLPAQPSPRKAPNGASSSAPSLPGQPKQDPPKDLGATYSPTHITMTREDGQVSRQIAVSEMMDQLVRFQQHNAQLSMANRALQDQRQHDAGIITSLRHEVTMFRQMCVNLQAEVTQLRAMSAPPGITRSTSSPPDGMTGSYAPRPHPGLQRPPPPPGMS